MYEFACVVYFFSHPSSRIRTATRTCGCHHSVGSSCWIAKIKPPKINFIFRTFTKTRASCEKRTGSLHWGFSATTNITTPWQRERHPPVRRAETKTKRKREFSWEPFVQPLVKNKTNSVNRKSADRNRLRKYKGWRFRALEIETFARTHTRHVIKS